MGSTETLAVADWPISDRDAFAAYERAIGRNSRAALEAAAFDTWTQQINQASLDDYANCSGAEFRDALDREDVDGDYFLCRILAQSTMAQVTRAYGQWLGFLKREDPTALADAPVDRITRDRLASFIQDRREVRKADSVATLLVQIRMILVRLTPRCTFEELKKTAAFWALKEVGGSSAPDLMLADEIFDLGLEMMKQAREAVELTPIRIGKRLDRRLRNRFRDGLVLAILATCPLRRGNIAGLELQSGENLRTVERQCLVIARRGPTFNITTEAAVVKNDVLCQFELPAELTDQIDFYLARIRPEYPCAEFHARLWCSSRVAAPIKATTINSITKSATKAAGRVSQTPRDIRRGAITYWAINDPANLERCRRLLGHKKASRVLSRSYNKVNTTAHAAKGLYETVMHFLEQ